MHCETCKFFETRGEYGGYCRRFPPQSFFEISRNAYGDEQYQSGWYQPWVTPKEWCGEHKPTQSQILNTPTPDTPASKEVPLGPGPAGPFSY